MGWWDRDREAECLASSGPPPWARTYAERNVILKSIGFDSYADYLKSDLWRDISARVLSKGRRCWVCKRRRSAREAHHDIYTRRNLLGETLAGIYPVCHICHLAIEFQGKHKRDLLAARAECRRLRKWKKWPSIVARRIAKKRRVGAASQAKARRLAEKAGREWRDMEAEFSRLCDRD